MKKITITFMTIFVLTLTACSGGTSTTQQAATNQTTTTSPTEMPLASKLVIGSFKLEGTGNAITAEQAAELIPLWQVYQQLSTSDTAAQEEITALAEQIQEAMTTDQMNAIDAMNLTPQDIFTVMQEQGIQFGGNRQQSQGSGSQQSGSNFGPPGGGGNEFFVRPEGGGQGGGPGGGGSGGFGGGQNLSPEQIATTQALREANGGGGNFRSNNTPAPLIEALVKLLQEKAGS